MHHWKDPGKAAAFRHLPGHFCNEIMSPMGMSGSHLPIISLLLRPSDGDIVEARVPPAPDCGWRNNEDKESRPWENANLVKLPSRTARSRGPTRSTRGKRCFLQKSSCARALLGGPGTAAVLPDAASPYLHMQSSIINPRRRRQQARSKSMGADSLRTCLSSWCSFVGSQHVRAPQQSHASFCAPRV